MRTRAQDLDRHLKGPLAPVYCLTGNEPLQLNEAADSVRDAARRNGFTTREVFDVGTGFDWNLLTTEANSLSLFAEKKLIELRVPSGKPGREGAAVLTADCNRAPADTLLLITASKLDSKQLSSKWVKAIDAVGVVLQVWPIVGSALVGWMETRMRAAGLEPGPHTAGILAERVEGNLLAAAQEIEKLLLTHGSGPIDAEQLLSAVTDCARFDVFEIVDTALRGDAAKTLRIMAALKAEGIASPVVLWAFARELRALLPIADLVATGVSVDQAMAKARIWDKRKPSVKRALTRLSPARLQALLSDCQRIDTVIKGAEKDDPWRLLEQLALPLAGRAAITAATA